MKKNFNFIFAAFAAFALLLSCAKEEVDTPVTGGSQNDQQNVVEPVTISATLSDAMTKVGFTPSYENGKPVQMALAWEAGDLLRVYNHDDRSKFDDFALDAASVGQKKGNFTGTPVNIQGATVYDVEVVAAEDFSYSAQTQPSDGVTTGLKYLAGVSGVASYSAVEFTDFSSVLAVTVKMPEGVAASVKSVDIKASENIFDGSDRLTVTLDQAGDAGGDGIVHFFATLPQGSTVIPSGTTLVAHINVPDTDHTVYTRFVELGSDLSFVENKLNTININATGSANYANASVANIGTETNPYLVGDKYQFDAMRNYLSSTMAYFEMVDDIDMTGIAWNPLNTTPANCFHFDGNNHTLSNVTSAKSQDYQSVFGCLSGTVQNLKVDKVELVTPTKISGIIASHLGGSGSTVETVVKNVTISNSTVGTESAKGEKKCGVLAGVAENGNGVKISDVTISDCSVATSTYTGGMIGQTGVTMVISGTNQIIRTNVYGGDRTGGIIGYVSGKLTMSGCAYLEGTVNGGKYTGGLIGRFEGGSVSDSYSSGAVNGGQYTGGVIGGIKSATVSNCYSSGDVTGFVLGGLIGVIDNSTVSMSNSVAWNPIVYSSKNEATRYSSAAVVGTTFPTCTLTSNYRNPEMDLTAYWVPEMATFQHADVSSIHPLTDSDGNEMTDTDIWTDSDLHPHYPIYPYHGKVDAGKTLSALARDVLGWSPKIWDFSGDLPVLK